MVCVNTCSHSCWSRVNTSLLQLLVHLCALTFDLSATEVAISPGSPAASDPRTDAQHVVWALCACVARLAVRMFVRVHCARASRRPAGGGAAARAPSGQTFYRAARQHCVNSVSTPLLGGVLVMCQHLFWARCWHLQTAKSVSTLILNRCRAGVDGSRPHGPPRPRRGTLERLGTSG